LGWLRCSGPEWRAVRKYGPSAKGMVKTRCHELAHALHREGLDGDPRLGCAAGTTSRSTCRR